ncbi:MAG: transglycosylase domain-containing protein [Candidatus Tectimicrobiota bacterium]
MRLRSRYGFWRLLRWGSGVSGLLLGLLAWHTWQSLLPVPVTLLPDDTAVQRVQLLDRHGAPLSITFQNPWNVHDYVPLHAIPAFLQQAFLSAEDQRFYTHRGVDWGARVQALLQNLQAQRVVRGASTITEQVVRMLHPRPRTLWSRWLEGFEALQLESRFSKAAILECYLNQIPYARQRRGVLQAARTYFDRDLTTLDRQEMLALAVLVRAPSRLDLWRDRQRLQPPLQRLAFRLHQAGHLSAAEYAHLLTREMTLAAPRLAVQASHFLQYVRRQQIPPALWQGGRLRTSLDASLQQYAQALLEGRMRDLQRLGVSDGALLVVDHQQNDILAWVSAGGSHFDAVRTPRQPGSTLKPLLYALALERGWTAATLVHDTPLEQPIGVGLHTYRNYSGQHYGPLRLREALGNSLNIPAVRTVDFVGVAALLERLHRLGFHSLQEPAEHYGNGLALGNGEVTLFELVQAYATLARQGLFTPLRVLPQELPGQERGQQVFSAEVSSIVADILADPEARRREFRQANLLRFPVHTAVKTGTSSDYRDAWAIGFSQRYTAGVWMGNLPQHPMRDVTGSVGPALVLRALFAELHRDLETRPLPRSPHLLSARICRLTGQRAGAHCPSMPEWFVPGTVPEHLCPLHTPNAPKLPGTRPPLAALRLLRPTPGLQLAMDPRIPDALEVLPFLLPMEVQPTQVDWLVDGLLVGSTARQVRQFLWPLVRGPHTVQARVWQEGATEPSHTPVVEFVVK